MSVMVVGGCGYIGAHVVRVLQKRQEEVVVVDDLSYGDAARIGSARLVQMDVADAGNYGRLVEALDGVTAVIHFAARKQVGASDQSLRGNQAVRGNHDGGLPASLRLEVDWAAVL